MADDSQEVADIIDALGEAPAPLDVYNATRDYDTRYLASAGAAAAAAGGGGGSQPGAVRVLKFPFDYTMATDLAAGVPVWTPAVDDVLLNAWFEFAPYWQGMAANAKADLGVITDGAWASIQGNSKGLFALLSSPVDLENVAWVSDTNYVSYPSSGFATQTDLLQNGIIAGGGSGLVVPQVRMRTTAPLSLVVSEDGNPGSGAFDGSAGSATLYLAISSPVTTP